jgi:integrase/recombinase XerD
VNGIQKSIIRRVCLTDYFTRRQFQRIVQATHEYDYAAALTCWHRARRMRVLVLLMRWSGLAIKDAVMLERKALDADGALFLRRAKTGVPVFVPLLPAVFSLLRTLPSANPVYFFWSGNGDPQSVVKGYGRRFRKTVSHC